jgi:hypothetical protein
MSQQPAERVPPSKPKDPPYLQLIKARIDYDQATQSDPYERWRRAMVAQIWGENDQT